MSKLILLLFFVIGVLLITSNVESKVQDIWRVVRDSGNVAVDEVELQNKLALPSWRLSSPKTKPKLNIEWDDDDHQNNAHDTEDNIIEPFSLQQQADATNLLAKHVDRNEQLQVAQRKSKLDRLVYHGELQQNKTIRLADGIRFDLNTYKPSVINRSSSTTSGIFLLPETFNRPGSVVQQTNEESTDAPETRINQKTNDRLSSWRPVMSLPSATVLPAIVVAPKKKQQDLSSSRTKLKISNKFSKILHTKQIDIDDKWRPIDTVETTTKTSILTDSTQHRTLNKFLLDKNQVEFDKLKIESIYGERKLEEPFEASGD